jgi:hypothetical protein
MLQFLPYALAALGGYKGYRDAKDSGASGFGRLLGAGIGAYGGYNLGQIGGFASGAGFGKVGAKNFVPSFTQTGMGGNIATQLGIKTAGSAASSGVSKFIRDETGQLIPNPAYKLGSEGRSVMDLLLKNKETGKIDPMKAAGLATIVPYALGAFDNQPTDIYMPGYNMGYLEMRDQRPGFTYIDPTTGQEKAYEKIYAPEEQGRGDPRMGPYSLAKTRLKTGGLAEIRKFNQGGINYLPSKVSHDENDSNNYVRAQGYVEDGSGNGDKDEDTMLAQLADGEFVTRADGVLGAGIIAGANPNSMKDMREKGAKYFYEQQKRFKRIFDLIEEKNGNSKQKTN